MCLQLHRLLLRWWLLANGLSFDWVRKLKNVKTSNKFRVKNSKLLCSFRKKSSDKTEIRLSRNEGKLIQIATSTLHTHNMVYETMLLILERNVHIYNCMLFGPRFPPYVWGNCGPTSLVFQEKSTYKHEYACSTHY